MPCLIMAGARPQKMTLSMMKNIPVNLAFLEIWEFFREGARREASLLGMKTSVKNSPSEGKREVWYTATHDFSFDDIFAEASKKTFDL